VSLATELEQTFTLAYALFHSGFLHMWRREFEAMRDRAVGLIDVADEHELEIWRALGRCMLGAARTALGRSEEGLMEIDEGIAMYKGLRTPPVFWPLLLFVRAEAHARAGMPADGLGLIEEAIEIAEEGSGLTLAPEFLRLRGELLHALSGPDGHSAEDSLLRAYEIAVELDARMPQLRAAIGLCRYDRERGDAERGSRLLGATFATFTEGFMTPDLIDAADLLEGVSDEAGPGNGSN
jgi:hypothetical protein